jgi:hypothetical protein
MASARKERRKEKNGRNARRYATGRGVMSGKLGLLAIVGSGFGVEFAEFLSPGAAAVSLEHRGNFRWPRSGLRVIIIKGTSLTKNLYIGNLRE